MFFLNNYTDVLTALWEHLEIASLAVGAAVLIGVPLGILISKKKGLAKPILGTASVFQTIPSLALFGLIIPILGIGLVPAITVLFLFALLPIITNTYIGITGIDPNLLEVARGMGMNKKEMLFKVELPLSVPVIMGGIKISSVTCIGTATIAALIGAGGLGSFIFRGIANGNNKLIFKGAIPAALLAVGVNFLFGMIEQALKPLRSSENIDWVHRFKKPIVAMGILVFLIPLTFSGFKQYNDRKQRAYTIRIGHKSFPEHRIIAQIYALLIEEYTDYQTKVLEFGGTQVVFQALNNYEIEMYPEYTGTIYTTILKKNKILDSKKTYDIAASQLKEIYNIHMLEPLKFNTTYVFVAKPELLNKYNIHNISDLKRSHDQFTVATDNEFIDRSDGLRALEAAYGIKFKDVRGMDAGLLITALINDKVNISVAYGTDGRIKKYGLKIIEDDKSFFPPYNVAPIFKEEFLKKYPECIKAFELLSGKLSDAEMQALNLKDSESDLSPREIARLYLKEAGLIQ